MVKDDGEPQWTSHAGTTRGLVGWVSTGDLLGNLSALMNVSREVIYMGKKMYRARFNRTETIMAEALVSEQYIAFHTNLEDAQRNEVLDYVELNFSLTEHGAQMMSFYML